jgi:hypothetical protein
MARVTWNPYNPRNPALPDLPLAQHRAMDESLPFTKAQHTGHFDPGEITSLTIAYSRTHPNLRLSYIVSRVPVRELRKDMESRK